MCKKYNRKHKYNTRYAGELTKRETEKRVDIMWTMIVLLLAVGVYQQFTLTSNDMTIQAVEKVVVEELPPPIEEKKLEFKPLAVVIEPQETKEIVARKAPIANDLDSKFGLNETVISLVDEWSEHYGYTNTHKAKAIISCEGKNDAGVCNYEYGCAGGQGHFQWIPSSWASICVRELGLTNVFDSSQNIQCGIYTLQKYGDSHWGSVPTVENPNGSWWGSRRCWTPKL